MRSNLALLAALEKIRNLRQPRGYPGFHSAAALVCAGNGDLFAGCFYAIALMEQRHGGNRSIEELLDFAIESLTECCASKCDFA
jgi:hypothetical protein